MENSLQKLQTIIRNKFFPIIIIIIIIAIFILVLVSQKTHTSTPAANKPSINLSPTSTRISENTRFTDIATNTDKTQNFPIVSLFPPEQKVAQVGEEIIYGKDLDYIIKTHYPADYIAKKTVEEIKQQALEVAREESILIQEEKKTGDVPVSKETYNIPDKDNTLRQKIVNEIKNKRLANQENISGGFISVWYHNVRMPSIPLADAQKLAHTKIQNVYNDIKSGKITFAQGGQRLRDDTSLLAIDKNHQGNAYYEFTDKTSLKPVFVYPELEDILWKLNTGEMSSVFQYPSSSIPLGGQEEEFYGIIKVTGRANPGAGNYNDWLDKISRQYKLTLL